MEQKLGTIMNLFWVFGTVKGSRKVDICRVGRFKIIDGIANVNRGLGVSMQVFHGLNDHIWLWFAMFDIINCNDFIKQVREEVVLSKVLLEVMQRLGSTNGDLRILPVRQVVDCLRNSGENMLAFLMLESQLRPLVLDRCLFLFRNVQNA